MCFKKIVNTNPEISARFCIKVKKVVKKIPIVPIDINSKLQSNVSNKSYVLFRKFSYSVRRTKYYFKLNQKKL